MNKTFLTLLNVAIKGESAPLNITDLTAEDYKSVLSLAKKHDLAHLIALALEKTSLLPTDADLKNRLLKERNVAMFRSEQQAYELEQISLTFAKAGINFIPLKGSVIKKY